VRVMDGHMLGVGLQDVGVVGTCRGWPVVHTLDITQGAPRGRTVGLCPVMHPSYAGPLSERVVELAPDRVRRPSERSAAL
jgi:hypothetical protein